MRTNMHMEMINLVKSLQGTYKQADKEMVVKTVNAYKKQHDCSYRQAYDMTVDGNPSYSAYTLWRRKAENRSDT